MKQSGVHRPLGGTLTRFGRFVTVGLSGLVVNALAMALFMAIGMPYLGAAFAATQVSTTWNFVGAEWWAFGGKGSDGRGQRLVLFFLMNNAAFLVRGPVIWLLTEVGHLHPVASNVVSLCLMTLLRFAVADTVIWASPRKARQASVQAQEL
jgi:putative flippase GtrA